MRTLRQHLRNAVRLFPRYEESPWLGGRRTCGACEGL